MSLRKKAVLNSIFLLFMLSNVYAEITEHRVLESVTVAWDPVSTYSDGSPCLVTRYDVGYVRDGEQVITAISVDGSVTQSVILRPRSGKFTIMVRACVSTNCSEWAVSTSPVYTGNNPFKVIFIPRPVTDIRIRSLP